MQDEQTYTWKCGCKQTTNIKGIVMSYCHAHEPVSAYPPNLEIEASNAGIDTYERIRAALIEWREEALNQAEFEGAVLLSHAIWWLSSLHDATKD